MNSLSSLLGLDGHALFVWGAWLPCLVLLVAEALRARARVRRARAHAGEEAA